MAPIPPRARALSSVLGCLALACGGKVGSESAGAGATPPVRGGAGGSVGTGGTGAGTSTGGVSTGGIASTGDRATGGIGFGGADPDPIPTPDIEARCNNICSMAAHPCRNAQPFEQCFDECWAASLEARECPAMESLLACYEDLSFELDPCAVDVDAIVQERCAESVQQVLRQCPGSLPGDPGAPRDPGDVVTCREVIGTLGTNSCFVEAAGCSDGRSYQLACRVGSGYFSCDCVSTTGGPSSGYGGPLDRPLEELCTVEALADCGYPILL